MDERNNESSKLQQKLKKMLIKKLIISSIGLLPIFIMIFVVLMSTIILVVIFNNDKESDNNNNCVTIQTANSVCNSISVKGYGTMSVDDYVAGVVQNEFGGAPDETLKSQAIAARSYGLAGATKSSNGNCSIGDTSEGFQTFNPNPSDRVKEAVKATSGMVLVDGSGNIARSEYSSNSLPAAYDSYGDTITMSERDLKIPRSWFSQYKTCSDTKLNTATSKKDAFGRVVYGCGHGRGMGQIAAKYLDTEKKYTYDKIIDFFYGKDSVYKWSLASSGGVSNTCSGGNGTLPELVNYRLKHEGLNALNRTLSDSERKDLDSYIDSQIKKAGYGTGAGVAAAGQSLVYWLEQKGFYLQYRWGGGHSYFTNCEGDSSTFTFSNPYWGSSCGYDEKHSDRRPYFGMDCSGFVSWATRTACKTGFNQTSGYWSETGKHISLSEAQPGDILDNPGSHVILVIKNNGDGSIITAEESGSNNGLVFTTYSDAGVYTVVSMQDWYSNNCDVKG